MNITIAQENPGSPDAIALITELDAYLIPLYPPSSHHGLTAEQLIIQQVCFFILRTEGIPAGCGGLKFFKPEYAEVKRMYVRPPYRGRGFGKQMLQHLEKFAWQQGIRTLRLETGISQPDAIGLYEHVGFQRRTPFGDYGVDPLSYFYEKLIG